MLEMIADALMETLPHGAGIDCDWTHTITKGSIRFHNSYHLMNEHGYYEEYQDITLVLPLTGDFEQDWSLQFNKPLRKTNSMFGLREYLEDVFGLWSRDVARFMWPDNFRRSWERK